MATLQVFIGNNTHEDPRKDAMCWKRGHIVEVYPDGVCTEPPDPGSKTVFIHIPGVSVEQVARYSKHLIEREDELRPGEERKKLGRRRFRLAVERLPQNIRETLQTEREITIQRQAVEDNIDDNLARG